MTQSRADWAILGIFDHPRQWCVLIGQLLHSNVSQWEEPFWCTDVLRGASVSSWSSLLRAILSAFSSFKGSLLLWSSFLPSLHWAPGDPFCFLQCFKSSVVCDWVFCSTLNSINLLVNTSNVSAVYFQNYTKLVWFICVIIQTFGFGALRKLGRQKYYNKCTCLSP